jgi:hypothetical protein
MIKVYKRASGAGYVTEATSPQPLKDFIVQNKHTWESYSTFKTNNGGIHSYEVSFFVTFKTTTALPHPRLKDDIKVPIKAHRVNIFHITEEDIMEESLSFWSLAWADGRF